MRGMKNWYAIPLKQLRCYGKHLNEPQWAFCEPNVFTPGLASGPKVSEVVSQLSPLPEMSATCTQLPTGQSTRQDRKTHA
jgi:hypothetical protein